MRSAYMFTICPATSQYKNAACEAGITARNAGKSEGNNTGAGNPRLQSWRSVTRADWVVDLGIAPDSIVVFLLLECSAQQLAPPQAVKERADQTIDVTVGQLNVPHRSYFISFIESDHSP